MGGGGGGGGYGGLEEGEEEAVESGRMKRGGHKEQRLRIACEG